MKPARPMAIAFWGGFLVALTGRSQDSPPAVNYDPRTPRPLSFVVPVLVRWELELKRYIRDPRFMDLRRTYGDLAAVDAVHLKALELTDSDVGLALLMSTAATIDHRGVRVRLPLGAVLSFPLTTEDDSLFEARWDHLPAHFWSRAEAEPHRDKLQHFFGSAYVEYASRLPGLAALVGAFIEWGEARFVVGGRSDRLDLEANERGRAFGRALGVEPRRLPSEFLGKEGDR